MSVQDIVVKNEWRLQPLLSVTNRDVDVITEATVALRPLRALVSSTVPLPPAATKTTNEAFDPRDTTQFFTVQERFLRSTPEDCCAAMQVAADRMCAEMSSECNFTIKVMAPLRQTLINCMPIVLFTMQFHITPPTADAPSGNDST